jgi:hypothetical protein
VKRLHGDTHRVLKTLIKLTSTDDSVQNSRAPLHHNLDIKGLHYLLYMHTGQKTGKLIAILSIEQQL